MINEIYLGDFSFYIYNEYLRKIVLSFGLNLNLAIHCVLVAGPVLPSRDTSRLLVMSVLIIVVTGLLTLLITSLGGAYLITVRTV